MPKRTQTVKLRGDRLCEWCSSFKSPIRFDKHEAKCKREAQEKYERDRLSIHGGGGLHTLAEGNMSLEAAREYAVPFTEGNVSLDFQGEEFSFDFQYRDPWAWILSLVGDSTLASHSTYHSVRKLYCDSDGTERLFDEPATGKAWEEIDDDLPDGDQYPHAYLPLHIWLDKGLVTKRVKKHPIVLRAAWLPSKIRNASGNGGGVLVGYMPIVYDPADPEDRGESDTLEWGRFKREVYQAVLAVIFGSLVHRSHHGDVVRCGDGIIRILHPGILIESMDGEESAIFTCIRSAMALFPCPKCLVPKSELHHIDRQWPVRTPEGMQAVIERARKAKVKKTMEDILKAAGLHFTKCFLWSMRNSNPYAAYCYDVLHSDDIGKWGKHLWPLLLVVMGKESSKGYLTECMGRIPRWPGLKRIKNVTTTEYTDGQTWFDILKRVGTQYGKDFDFFKQHATSHAASDIEQRGATQNFSTRPGEGFQQESAQAYEQTNRKNTDPQMSRYDQTLEALATIRMTVDAADARESPDANDTVPCQSDSTADEDQLATDANAHWSLGAPQKLVLISEIKTKEFPAFERKLRLFLSDVTSDDTLTHEHIYIKIRPYACIYLKYQSMEDWTLARDILRCSPSFHGEKREDCAIINMAEPRLVCARICGLYRCMLPSGEARDVAFVRMFSRTDWRPRTAWKGCDVHEESRTYRFVLAQYLVRGAHMIPAFYGPTKVANERFYFNDLIDYDMFLRAGN
ncbi:hypothetical protein HWV62_34677 [Athelia sp. TMB]|nr:hypothetical protein HWV62_34677 [Athelia sp. TMB]